MTFLHLADLHIGKSVNSFSMLDEQKHAFTQIIGYVRSEKPGAVIIAGDVYDRAVPGVEAVRLFDNFLTDLAHENVPVLLIAGNHDSPERLNFASRLLEEKQLFVRGVFEGAPRRISFNDEFGAVHFWLVPFIKPSVVRGIAGIQTENDDSYTAMFAAVLEAANIDYAERNILVAHQFFTASSAKATRSDSEIDAVGGLDAIDSILLKRFDYAAIGHLHAPQSAGSEHIRYAGSPVKYSFSEWRHKKTAALVSVAQKGSVSTRELPLCPIHDMREIKGPISELMSDKISSLSDKEDYLRVILTDEDEIIDPMGKIRSVYPNTMLLELRNSRTNIDLSDITSDPDVSLSPYNLFSEFFLKSVGAVMSAEQEKIVRGILENEAAQ